MAGAASCSARCCNVLTGSSPGFGRPIELVQCVNVVGASSMIWSLHLHNAFWNIFWNALETIWPSISRTRQQDVQFQQQTSLNCTVSYLGMEFYDLDLARVTDLWYVSKLAWGQAWLGQECADGDKFYLLLSLSLLGDGLVYVAGAVVGSWSTEANPSAHQIHLNHQIDLSELVLTTKRTTWVIAIPWDVCYPITMIDVVHPVSFWLHCGRGLGRGKTGRCGDGRKSYNDMQWGAQDDHCGQR